MVIIAIYFKKYQYNVKNVMNILIKIPTKNRGRGIPATGADQGVSETGESHRRMIRIGYLSVTIAAPIYTAIKNISPSTLKYIS